MWSGLDKGLPDIKRRLAHLAGCEAEEIALNRNSSEGLSTAVFGIDLVAGDQVLVCPWDYPSALGAWRQRSLREGIEVVVVQFGIRASDEEIIEAYRCAMTDRTRVLHLTHMLHWNGHLLPVAELCRMARERAVTTIVDGAQTFAQLPVSFRDIDCDFFVTSLHKWLGAPVGNGMLVVREDRIDRSWPLLGPFDPPPLRIDKFDHWNLGTYNSAIQAGIRPAIEMYGEIGPLAMHERLCDRTRYWIERVRDIPGFRLHTDITAEHGAIALFSIDGADMRGLETTMRDAYKVHTKFRSVNGLDGIRVSPHVFTSDDDLDNFCDALRRSLKMA